MEISFTSRNTISRPTLPPLTIGWQLINKRVFNLSRLFASFHPLSLRSLLFLHTELHLHGTRNHLIAACFHGTVHEPVVGVILLTRGKSSLIILVDFLLFISFISFYFYFLKIKIHDNKWRRNYDWHVDDACTTNEEVWTVSSLFIYKSFVIILLTASLFNSSPIGNRDMRSTPGVNESI